MDDDKKVVDATDGTQHNKPADVRFTLAPTGLKFRAFADPEAYEAMLDSMERNEEDQKGSIGEQNSTPEEGA